MCALKIDELETVVKMAYVHTKSEPEPADLQWSGQKIRL